ncbi:MAG: PDZ domain-containing protein [Aquificaceae bacterium]
MLLFYPLAFFTFFGLLLLYLWIGVSLKVVPPSLKRESIQTSDLFSKFESLYPKPKKEEGTLSIKLLATAAGSVRLALIEVNGSIQTVRVGSEVKGYRVVDIERNYIVFLKDKHRLAIGFSFKEEASPTQVSKGTPLTPQTTKSLQASIPREEIRRITADPGIMFRQIRLVPFVQDGRTRGFLFEWIEPGSIFERAGIKPGDVLLSINNQEIKSGEDAFVILQMLRNESSIKLNLQRGNELIELLLRVEG